MLPFYSPPSLRTWAALLLCGVAWPSSAVAQQFISLRYRLNVGDRLVYERRCETRPMNGNGPSDRWVDQLQVWCLRRDGTEWFLLVDRTRLRGKDAEPVHGLLLHLDDLGQQRLSLESQERLPELDEAFELFPGMRIATNLTPDWTSAADFLGRRWKCRMVATDPQQPNVAICEMTLDDESGAATALGVSWSGRFWFDLTSGLVTRMESKREDRQSGQVCESVTVLHSHLHNTQRWSAKICEDAERYLRALRGEDRLLDELVTRPAEIETILRKLERLWNEFVRESLDETSPFRGLGIARRQWLGQRLPVFQQRAASAAYWLGRPAGQWSLQDETGQTIDSESLRGTFVVECFWSIRSPWSVHMMHTLRSLAKRAPGDVVRVVCINIDEELSLARQAVSLCGQDLTHVLAGPPLGGEAPRELPLVRVLDRQSRIVRVFIGWRASILDGVLSALH